MKRYRRARWGREHCILLALIVLGQAPLLARAWAESMASPALTIIVSPEIAIQPGVDAPMDIRVEPPEAAPPQSMLIIKGAPAGASLSEGKSFSEGQWVVPIASLKQLKIRSPKETVLSLQLFNLDGQKLADRQVALVMSPQRRLLTPNERAFALKMIEKGVQSMEAGNVIVAREFFQRAADRGLAEGAVALGATYDPRELARFKIGASIQPDAELARKWYENARRLGSEEAVSRLRLLSGEVGKK